MAKLWQIKFSMGDHLRWRFRAAVARRRMTQTQALQQAAEEWVVRPDTTAEQSLSAAADRHESDASEEVGRGYAG